MAAVLTFALTYWRGGALVLGLIGALWLGFWVNGRLERAKEADALETKLVATEKALVVLRDYKVLLSAQIADMDRALETETREVIKYVPQYVVGDCTLEPDGVRALNRARGVPDPAGGVAPAAPKTNPPP